MGETCLRGTQVTLAVLVRTRRATPVGRSGSHWSARSVRHRCSPPKPKREGHQHRQESERGRACHEARGIYLGVDIPMGGRGICSRLWNAFSRQQYRPWTTSRIVTLRSCLADGLGHSGAYPVTFDRVSFSPIPQADAVLSVKRFKVPGVGMHRTDDRISKTRSKCARASRFAGYFLRSSPRLRIMTLVDSPPLLGTTSLSP